MASQTERLEREAEEARTDLSHTLDELRARMTPGQLVDQVIDSTRDGEIAETLGNLRRQVVDNPLALGLIGAGLAWLMIPHRANGDDRTAERVKHAGRQASTRIHDAGFGAMEAGSAAADRLNEAARSGTDALSEASQRASGSMKAAGQRLADSAYAAGDAASQGYESLARTASGLTESVSSLGRNVAATTGSARRSFRGARHDFMDLCRKQPLILAGLGLSIGAAIGAALPRTESEDQLMGAASDDIKEGAQALAGDAVQRATDLADDMTQEAAEATKQTAEDMAGRMEDAVQGSGGDSSSETPSIIPLPDETAAKTEDREPMREH